MKRIYIIVALVLLGINKGSSQKIETYFKTIAYLEVCKDQLEAGPFESVKDFNFDSLYIDSIKLSPLNSIGFPLDFIFYKMLLTVHKKEVSYIFCYNKTEKTFFKLKGFYRNDYYSFFSNLERLNIKVSIKNFLKDNIQLDSVDFNCLIDLYQESKKKKVDIQYKVNRSEYNCLKYNFQPIITY